MYNKQMNIAQIWRRGPPRTARLVSGLTALALLAGQLALPPRAAASHLGSSTASAGSAPPAAVSAIQRFQPDLFTGRATTAIPIAVLPGRRGVQPSLALGYSSSGRNGWVGVGWGLKVGAIERSTKRGVPWYDASDTFTPPQQVGAGFTPSFQGITSDLVRIADGTYRRQQVTGLPYSGGTSFQRAPVRSTQRMPLIVRRSSTRGRPSRFSRGKSGSMCAHGCSVKSVSRIRTTSCGDTGYQKSRGLIEHYGTTSTCPPNVKAN